MSTIYLARSNDSFISFELGYPFISSGLENLSWLSGEYAGLSSSFINGGLGFFALVSGIRELNLFISIGLDSFSWSSAVLAVYGSAGTKLCDTIALDLFSRGMISALVALGTRMVVI